MIDAILSLLGAAPTPGGTPAPATGGFGSLLQTMLTAAPAEGGAVAGEALTDGVRLSRLAATSPDPDVAKLSPELRARLARVIARMSAEHGHDVRIVEGLRSGARQDYLYAQGRVRPGPVVTWTRESRHEQGLAADLIVDGRYDNAEAYRTLQRVAREEGLHTLGMTDPGHVELPGDNHELRGGDPAHRGPAPRGTEGLAAGLAAASATAAPARIAAAARPAAPARPAARAASAAPAAIASPAPIAGPAGIARRAAMAAPAGAGQGAPPRGATSGSATAAGDREASLRPGDGAYPDPARGATAGPDRGSAVRSTPQPSSASAIAEVDQLRSEPAPESAAPRTTILSGATADLAGTRANAAPSAASAPESIRSVLASAVVGAAAGGDADPRGKHRTLVLDGIEEVRSVARGERATLETSTSRALSAPGGTDGHVAAERSGGSLRSGAGRAESDGADAPRTGEAADRVRPSGADADAAREAAPETALRDVPAPARSDADGLRTRGPRPLEAVQPGARIDAIDALREQAGSQPLHRVSLLVGEGVDAARVRVDLRGDRVQAELATDSDRLATRLRHEAPELGRTLERQGIEVDALRVRQGDRVAPETVLMRAAETARSSDGGSSQRDRDAGAQRQQEHGRERPRRERDQEKDQ